MAIAGPSRGCWGAVVLVVVSLPVGVVRAGSIAPMAQAGPGWRGGGGRGCPAVLTLCCIQVA